MKGTPPREKLGETEALERTKRGGILGLNGASRPTQALLSTLKVLPRAQTLVPGCQVLVP